MTRRPLHLTKRSYGMERNRRVLPLVALACVAVAAFSAGCKKKAPTSAAEARPPVTSKDTGTPVAPPPTTAPRGDVEANVLNEDLAIMNKKGYLTDAFFDYDQSDLREDARTALAANANWLKKYNSIQILVEGHCDERGTAAYNLALGDRRANAVKEYLSSLGIDGSRVRTVSYGKERPFCTESTESCWQQNRRGHIVITAK
jgi:peptidoglycan-associated lipoprotein